MNPKYWDFDDFGSDEGDDGGESGAPGVDNAIAEAGQAVDVIQMAGGAGDVILKSGF